MSGIYPDDISSYTTCYGIYFYESDREHESYRHFIEKGEKYVLTLSNLSRLTRAERSGKKVFIIENQMVFSQVCEEMGGEEYSVMCTSGQLKTASLFLIDMLIKSGCELYYCGDIAPEGIEIADNLKKYSGQFKLRIPRSLHKSLAEHSKKEGISMNQYCVYLLSRNDAMYTK